MRNFAVKSLECILSSILIFNLFVNCEQRQRSRKKWHRIQRYSVISLSWLKLCGIRCKVSTTAAFYSLSLVTLRNSFSFSSDTRFYNCGEYRICTSAHERAHKHTHFNRYGFSPYVIVHKEESECFCFRFEPVPKCCVKFMCHKYYCIGSDS